MLNGLALCAGGGALDLGLKLALGGGYRTVGHVEREAFAAAVLVARMEDEALDRDPVWDDLSTFDARPWRGVVDLVSAGFPCQPFSAAGLKQGLDDDRWLWPQVRRVVHDVGPSYVFVENVRGFLAGHGGLGTVLGDLADLGFDAEWEVLSAAEVGATHRRERFWLLAYSDEPGRPSLRWEPEHDGDARHHIDGPRGEDVADAERSGRHGRAPEPRRGPERGTAAQGAGEVLADASSLQPERGRGPDDVAGSSGGPQGEARQRQRRGDAAGDSGQAVADPHGSGGQQGQRQAGPRPPQRPVDRPGGEGMADAPSEGREGQGLRRLPAERGPLWPPAPDDAGGWAEVVARSPSLEPALHRMADGLACRVERSHLIGNGVVPLVAAAALLRLADRAGLLVKETAA